MITIVIITGVYLAEIFKSNIVYYYIIIYSITVILQHILPDQFSFHSALSIACAVLSLASNN